MNIADLKFKVDKAELDAAKDSLKDLGKEIPGVSKQVDTLGEAFDKLKNPVTMAIGLFAAAAAGAMKLGYDAIEAADNLKDLSTATGQASEDLQVFAEIAAKSGGDVDTLTNSLSKLAVKMTKGTEDFTKSLDYFNVSLTDSNGNLKDQVQLAEEAANAYLESNKNASAVAAITEILGKNYKETVNSLSELSTKEDEHNKLMETGAIKSKELMEASDEYNDSVRDLHKVQEGIGNYVASTFLPLLTGIAKGLYNSSTNGGLLNYALDALGKVLFVVGGALKGVATFFIGLDNGIQLVSHSVTLLTKLFDALLSWDANKAKQAWKEYTTDVVKSSQASADAIKDLWKTVDAKGAGKPGGGGTDLGDLNLGGNGRGGKGAKTAKDKKEDTDWIKQQQKDINDLQSDIAKAQQAEEKRLDGLARKYRDLIDPLQKYRDAEAEIEELYKAGKISADEMTEAVFRNADAMMDAAFKNEKSVDKQKDQYEELIQAVEGYTQKMADSFVDFAIKGEGSFKDLVASILEDLARMLANEAWKQLGNVLGGSGEGGGWGGAISAAIDWIMSANGNVFSGGNLQQFSGGGVVSTPTTFGMGGGKTGLMSEADPEAIMPLKRLSSGRLGVETTGMMGQNTVNNNSVVIENINVKADENTDGNKVGRQVAEQVKAIVLQTLHNERRPGNSLNPVGSGSSF